MPQPKCLVMDTMNNKEAVCHQGTSCLLLSCLPSPVLTVAVDSRSIALESDAISVRLLYHYSVAMVRSPCTSNLVKRIFSRKDRVQRRCEGHGKSQGGESKMTTARSGNGHNMTRMQRKVFFLHNFPNTFDSSLYTNLDGHGILLAGPTKSMAGHSSDEICR